MERYFYFGETTVSTTGSSCMFPLSSFLGITPASPIRTTLHFKSRNGAATDDQVLISHATMTPKEFMTELVGFMKSHPRDAYLIIQDNESSTTVPGFSGTIEVASVTTEA
jgi:hypothetical protein